MISKRRVLIVTLVLFLVLVFAMPTALAAKGKVSDINMPQKHGTITVEEDGVLIVYQFQIPKSLSDPDNTIKEGDTVEFDVDPVQSRRATNLRLVDDDPSVPQDGDIGDPADDDPGSEIILPFGLERIGKIPHGWSIAFENAGPHFPDVCKTPAPGGPVPIPYPNIAMCSNIN
jgi:hypothetical protein